MVILNNTGFSSVKIFCESRTAISSFNSARKVWALKMPIVIPNATNITMLCSVESASIPLSYYTINETNNKFSFNSVAIGEIPHGNYSVNTLISALHKAQTHFVFSYDKTTSKLSIISHQIDYNTIDDIPNNIYKLIGLKPNTQFSGINYVAPNPINLVYTSGIYLSLNSVPNANLDLGTTNQSSNVLLRIPISQPTNTYLQYFNPIGFKNLLSTKVLASIDLSLLDDNRNLLQLTDNVDWSVVLRIDFERTIVETQETTKIHKLKMGL
jgi:hypothetical protein